LCGSREPDESTLARKGAEIDEQIETGEDTPEQRSETLLFGDEDEKPLGAGSLVRGKPTSRFFET
jgi:hypothetical protein